MICFFFRIVGCPLDHGFSERVSPRWLFRCCFDLHNILHLCHIDPVHFGSNGGIIRFFACTSPALVCSGLFFTVKSFLQGWIPKQILWWHRLPIYAIFVWCHFGGSKNGRRKFQMKGRCHRIEWESQPLILNWIFWNIPLWLWKT